MIKKFYPPSLYNFLRYINSNPLERKILDCGAGGRDPNLHFFLKMDLKSMVLMFQMIRLMNP